MPVNRSTYGFLPLDDWFNELVFAFGDAEVDSSIPEEFVIQIPSSKFINPIKFCASIDKELFRNGFTFLASPEFGVKEGPKLQELQMHIVAAYYRNRYFDKEMTYKPEGPIKQLLGMLGDSTRAIGQLYNMPWLLRSPIVDKIDKKKIGLPVLIVTSGPSQASIKEHLKKYAKHCLVICIARTLQLCLDVGVEPDFVVQYDTHPEQKLFYENIPRLDKTLLVALSSASIADYAWKFRGVVFRGSFKKIILKNDFTLRDSTEGSLLACMGLAEILHAPDVYMAGCDFSWHAEDTPEQYKQLAPEERKLSLDDYRIGVGWLYVLTGRGGKFAYSEVGYVAAAARAAEFAVEINKTIGTRFWLTSDIGILSPKHFPTMGEEDVCANTEIDRSAYLETIDEVLQTREDIDLKVALPFFKEREDFLNSQELNFRFKKYNPDFEFGFHEDLIQLCRNSRSFFMQFGEADAGKAHRMVIEWAKALNYASRVTMSYTLAEEHGEKIIVLCKKEEQERLQERVNTFFPKQYCEFRVLVDLANGSGGGEDNCVPYSGFMDWVKEQKVIFISHTIGKEYHPFFKLYEGDNVILLPNLVG
ncbi:DUF115 domain-containing protein [Pseudodesulfovibrio sp.]|nr:DUF115 domain-containing protein [Pseudodesulfovibrio sp.]